MSNTLSMKSPKPIGALSEKRQHDFWTRVKRTPDSCWDWIGCVSGGGESFRKKGTGYGVFDVHGRQMNAHRIAAALTFDKFDDSLWVLHLCDNPRCVRPSHLFQGTQIDNFNDALSKGRSFVGSEGQRAFASDRYAGAGNPRAVLSADDVATIRRRYATEDVSQESLASQYGVDQTHISRVVRMMHWKVEA